MRAPADLRPGPGEWLLLAVVAWQLLFWVPAPSLAYQMLPLDTLELLGWGQEWQLGYYKHPPLGAWLGEATRVLAGGQLAALYLLAQLLLVATLLYVWKVARLWLDRDRAALAAVLLQGSYFHTVLVPNFNMNTLQLPLWAGFCYHLLRALQGAQRHWLAAGAFAALALLAKYSGLLLLASAAVLVLWLPQGRAALRSRWPWLGALLALALLAPHLAWLSVHWRLPLEYLGSFDGDAAASWTAHLSEPLRFAAGALLSLAPVALLLLPLTRGARAAGCAAPARGDALHRAALGSVLVLTLGPLLLAMLYGALTGSRLKSTWAFSFFNLAGVALLLALPTRVDRSALRRFTALLVAMALLVGGGHLAYKLRGERSKTAFDGPALAAATEEAWQRHGGGRLRVVIGDHVLSAIIAAYVPGNPSMLVQGDFRRSPWLTPGQLARTGAIAVCTAGTPCFPDLRPQAAPSGTLQVDGRTFDYWVLAPRG